MKKILSMILASVLVLSLLAACGGGNNQSSQNNQQPPADSSQTPDSGGDAEPAGSGTTIQVAALASGYEEAYPGMWQEVCDAFTAETGINVELICDKNLEDVIGPAMQGGEFPDVIHLATGREKGLTEQFIKDRNIA